MNAQVKLFSVLALAMLAGTKNISEKNEPSPKKSLNIVFIGDSITEGNGTAAPPVRAAAYLLRQLEVEKLDFSNQGHSGFTTVDFLPSQGETFKQVELAADSLLKINQGMMIFSIMLGTNDSAMDGPLGSPVSATAYRRNLMEITDRLLKDYPGCKIILHQPVWYSPNTYNRSRYLADGLKRLQSYFPVINALIESYGHTHPQQVFPGDKSAFDFFKKNYKDYMLPEKGQQGIFYLHPNDKGAGILGNFWGAAIYKVIQKLQLLKTANN